MLLIKYPLSMLKGKIWASSVNNQKVGQTNLLRDKYRNNGKTDPFGSRSWSFTVHTSLYFSTQPRQKLHPFHGSGREEELLAANCGCGLQLCSVRSLRPVNRMGRFHGSITSDGAIINPSPLSSFFDRRASVSQSRSIFPCVKL